MDGGPLLTGGCDAAIDRGERNAKTINTCTSSAAQER